MENIEQGLVDIASLISKFAKVNRVTLLEDGVTLESDTDHTVMLGVCACSVASKLYPALDIGKIAQYALVHDLVEAYAGDTNTFNFNTVNWQEKAIREEKAFQKIKDEFSANYNWIAGTITQYDKQEDDEAKFVKLMDKVMTKLTHRSNGGAYFKKNNVSKEEAENHLVSQAQILDEKYGDKFPEIITIIRSLSDKIMREVY